MDGEVSGGAGPERALAWMIVSGFAFAVMGECAHALKDACDWQLVAVSRTVVSVVISVLLVKAAGARLAVLRPRMLWSRSLAGCVGVLCTFYALPRLPVADAVTLGNTTPIWIALISWLVLKEHPPLLVWVAVGLGIVGVGLIEQPHLQDQNFAALIALLGSVGAAVAMLSLNRLKGVHTAAVVAHFAATSTVAGLLALAASPTPVHLPAPSTANVLLLLGVGLSGTVGQLALTRAYALDEAPRVASFQFVQIVFAAAFDVLLWNQRFSAATLVGMALIAATTFVRYWAPVAWGARK